jgi:magnesium transporter
MTISRYILDDARLKACGAEENPVWVDLLKPDANEISEIDTRYAVSLPTLEEMREIEVSSRLYEEDGAYYMTFIYIADALGDQPRESPVTFMLKGDVLVTVRYTDMRVITGFLDKAQSKGISGHRTSADVMTLLLENIVDLCADALEKGHMEIESESLSAFTASGKKDYKQSLQKIAGISDLNSKMRESLASLNRLTIFLRHAIKHFKVSEDTTAKLDSLAADIQSLLDHSGFVSNKISFLLDATLGLVNIEQNAIIKIFSVASVIFLPPTLVASIYGMNFKRMPELDWAAGYPWALGLMVVSAALPYWYFKRQKWL